ncbi:alpha/beta hydrolase [Aureimonas sp. OT7]|uniref:alpha/beta fold hydrolase n=1 Tax=Aureimonas sp. OT7 TaxID=2816454 RepID=UPI0017842A19|nr:alpha/beta hydrolase [Aureimonas sp. OT7]QOG08323.1 alpha/beta hydrolase [Aureimonas sp. OT7]
MFDDIETTKSPSGAHLAIRSLEASGRPRGILLIQHGLAEHSGRYGRFAVELAARGLHVVAHDHRGHGATTAPDAPPRRFAARKGAACVVADSAFVGQWARARFGPLPQVVFGHSMGGLVAANLAARREHAFAGVAIWNSDLVDDLRLATGRILLKAERALKGSDTASMAFRRATFDVWKRSVPDRRTDFDWLTHDPAVVDAYCADPLCGWTPTNSMAVDILDLIRSACAPSALSAWPKQMPVHLLAGSADPATRGGKALAALHDRIGRSGRRNATLSIIDGARHETLNETGPYRAPAMAALLSWLDAIIDVEPRR